MVTVLHHSSEEMKKIYAEHEAQGSRMYLCSPYRLSERVGQGYTKILDENGEDIVVKDSVGDIGLILMEKKPAPAAEVPAAPEVPEPPKDPVTPPVTPETPAAPVTPPPAAPKAKKPAAKKAAPKKAKPAAPAAPAEIPVDDGAKEGSKEE